MAYNRFLWFFMLNPCQLW